MEPKDPRAERHLTQDSLLEGRPEGGEPDNRPSPRVLRSLAVIPMQGRHPRPWGPTGWINRLNRIRGLSPPSVERYLNEALGIFAPGATTVAKVARSYAARGC